jgi:diguanylate cyclase (GGDEF)-like protein
LGSVFQDTASLVGDEFVGAALVSLRHSLEVRYVLLGENLNHSRVRVRKCWSDGDRELADFEYHIAGAPCEGVLGREPCCYPSGVKALFPGHPLVHTLDVDGYLGFPLFGSDGRALGLLALLHDAPLKDPDLALATCGPLARRISAELERTRLEQELRQSERHFREIAFNDQLTGLANRRLLMDRLAHAVKRARRFGHEVAVLFLDIDDFKRVNDCAGHDVGDQVLVHAARRIGDAVRSADTVARLGGDEFVILLEQCGNACQAQAAAEHVLRALCPPVNAAGCCWSLSTSIGISIYDGRDPNIQVLDLLKQADQAMYAAKKDGPGHYRVFLPQPLREEA